MNGAIFCVGFVLHPLMESVNTSCAQSWLPDWLTCHSNLTNVPIFWAQDVTCYTRQIAPHHQIGSGHWLNIETRGLWRCFLCESSLRELARVTDCHLQHVLYFRPQLNRVDSVTIFFTIRKLTSWSQKLWLDRQSHPDHWKQARENLSILCFEHLRPHTFEAPDWPV